MADLRDVFGLKSKEENAREMEEFQSRVFPFGEEEKNTVESILKQVCMTPASDRILLFLYTVQKDFVTSDPDSSHLYDKKCWRIGPKLTLQEKASIIALATLSKSCKSLEEYPSPSQVQTEATHLIEATPIPKKKWWPFK